MSDKLVRNIVEQKCEHCNGQGMRYSEALNTNAMCPYCGGTGKRPTTQDEAKKKEQS